MATATAVSQVRVVTTTTATLTIEQNVGPDIGGLLMRRRLLGGATRKRTKLTKRTHVRKHRSSNPWRRLR
jgi:hypothetical protein